LKGLRKLEATATVTSPANREDPKKVRKVKVDPSTHRFKIKTVMLPVQTRVVYELPCASIYTIKHIDRSNPNKCVHQGREHPDPSLTLRMTNWVCLVILRTEVVCPELAEGKNLDFEILK
jgi:hypothetical protein